MPGAAACSPVRRNPVAEFMAIVNGFVRNNGHSNAKPLARPRIKFKAHRHAAADSFPRRLLEVADAFLIGAIAIFIESTAFAPPDAARELTLRNRGVSRISAGAHQAACDVGPSRVDATGIRQTVTFEQSCRQAESANLRSGCPQPALHSTKTTDNASHRACLPQPEPSGRSCKPFQEQCRQGPGRA